MTRTEHLVEAAAVLRELYCGDTVHMGLAGNPSACEPQPPNHEEGRT